MIYLDNAATTTITQPVLDEMFQWLTDNYGNASSLCGIGRKAKNAIETARKQVARAINAKPEQIFFTSGATESNNWVISNFNYVICSKVEHHSILNNPKCHQIDFSDLSNQIYKNNADLATYMLVNNETGQIFDIKPLVEISHKMGILFHTDATQAFGHIPIDVKELNVDSLSLSGHKFHAPKGIGVLYLKDPSQYKPLLYGGGQESNLRAGTENVANIVAIGKACELYNFNADTNESNILKRQIFMSIINTIPNITVNTNISNSIPTTVNISFKNIEGESLMLLLDVDGICVSSGSACNSSNLEPSHVLQTMGVPSDYIYGTIRISFDYNTTKNELITAAECIKKNVERLRKIN